MNRKITATAETGEVFTRRTDRTYTHAVYVEITYSDGRVNTLTPSWAGRPDLAERNLRKSREFAARMQGEEVCHWDKEGRVYVGTGIFRDKVRAVAVPVNA
jgi:hypothetical protein